MIINKLNGCRAALLLVLALVLTACPSPSATPTPTPRPAATLIPTAPAPTPSATPTGWKVAEGAGFSISLPADWTVLVGGQGDMTAVFAEFQRRNPEMARLIGDATALQGVDLWAFGPAAGTGQVDNMNIRRSPLAGQTADNLQASLDAVAAQYGQIGFSAVVTQAGLRIGDRPAGRITYTTPLFGADGKALTGAGTQYFIIGPANLWLLSYTADAARPAAAAVIEQSAQTFRVR